MRACVRARVCGCTGARVRVRARMRARACVRVCVRACEYKAIICHEAG